MKDYKIFYANYRLILYRVWEINGERLVVEAFSKPQLSINAKYIGSYYKFIRINSLEIIKNKGGILCQKEV